MGDETRIRKLLYFSPPPPPPSLLRYQRERERGVMGRSLLGFLTTTSPGLLQTEQNGSSLCSRGSGGIDIGNRVVPGGGGGRRRSSYNRVNRYTNPFNNSRRWRVANCRSSSSGPEEEGKNRFLSSAASSYQILGVDPSCSPAQLKAAFRARVKEFHPDVCKDMGDSDTIIRRVIQAYEGMH